MLRVDVSFGLHCVRFHGLRRIIFQDLFGGRVDCVASGCLIWTSLCPFSWPVQDIFQDLFGLLHKFKLLCADFLPSCICR